MEKVKIDTEFIKLDSFLKWCNVVGSGAEAKMVVQDGLVYVNGEVCTQRGKKLRAGDKIKFYSNEYEIINK